MVDAIIQERSTKGERRPRISVLCLCFLSRAALEGDGEKTRRGARDIDVEICTEVVAPSPKKCYLSLLDTVDTIHCCFWHFVFPFSSSFVSLSSFYLISFLDCTIPFCTHTSSLLPFHPASLATNDSPSLGHRCHLSCKQRKFIT